MFVPSVQTRVELGKLVSTLDPVFGEFRLNPLYVCGSTLGKHGQVDDSLGHGNTTRHRLWFKTGQPSSFKFNTVPVYCEMFTTLAIIAFTLILTAQLTRQVHECYAQ